MAYQTGVSTSPSNLLTSLATRLSTDGWTIVRSNGLAESGSSLQLSVSDPGIPEGNQYNFVAYDSPAANARWDFQPSTGDSGSSANFYAHTGSPDNSGSNETYCRFGNNRISGADQGFAGSSVAYHFFSGTTPSGARYCHIVVEGTAGVFFHIHFGTYEKAGSFIGGQYATMHVQDADNSSQQSWPLQFNPNIQCGRAWHRFDDYKGSGSPGWRRLYGFTSNNGASDLTRALYQGGLDEATQRTPFGPILMPYWETNTPSTSNAWVLAGHIPDLMAVSMDGREPGEIITLGSDDWHLFPIHRKTTDGTSVTTSAYQNTYTSGSAPNNDSNLMGLAYREP